MGEFIKGQVMTFAETKCPTCRHEGLPHGAGAAIAVDRIWDGSQWLLLDSWAGKSLAMELGSVIEVAELQPDNDSPGLWIGFKTAADREQVLKWFSAPGQPTRDA